MYNKKELYHHGIKGQKWGVRRYQNEDGTLTAAGQKRYGTQEKADYASLSRKQKKAVKQFEKSQRQEAHKKSRSEYNKATDYADKHGLDYDDVVYKEERANYIKASKKSGNYEKVGKHIIEYNKKLDVAEIKETQYYKEAKDSVNKMIRDLAAANRKSFANQNQKTIANSNAKTASSMNIVSPTNREKSNIEKYLDRLVMY